MESREFLAVCKAKIADYVNDHIDKTDQKHLTINDVYTLSGMLRHYRIIKRY